MKKGKACVVRGCTSTKRSLRHRFPKDPVKSYVWSCAVQDVELQKMSADMRQKFFVCHQHFPEEAYKVTSHRCQLLDSAVPCRNIPEESTPDMEVSEDQSFDGDLQHQVTGTSLLEENLQTWSSLDQGEVVVCRKSSEERVGDSQDEGSSSLSGSPDEEDVKPASIRKNTILGSIKRQASLDPKAKALYKKAVLFKRKYDRLRREFKKHRRDMDPKTSMQLAEKFTASLTRVQKQFWDMLLRNSKNAPSARRFTVEQQLFCLSLYKQSPSCYRFLTNFFPLPSRTTLMKLLGKVPVKTGIMDEVIQHLQFKAQKMTDEREKACILIWDEVSLEPHLKYDPTADQIVGFEDWGTRRTKKVADHCLVFMLKGLYSGWKVPVAYNFCESQTPGPQLMSCIKQVVQAIERTGMQIIASVCDQGTSNTSAIDGLLLESNTKRFHRGENSGDAVEIGNTKFFHLYDVPHLLKGTRNNLLTKDLEVDLHLANKGGRKFASWDIVQLAYTMDTNGPSRQLRKLTDEHIIIDKIKKMKVKYAAQVFSETLANYIEFTSTISGHVNSRIGPLKMPVEGLETASVLKFFNKLFDSLNGHKKKVDVGIKGLLTAASEHHSFWPDACQKLRGMRFVIKDSKQSNSRTDVPTMRNWVKTITSVQNIWKVVNEMRFDCLETRHLNQDCLENFFGQMRSHGRRNVNPNCNQFQGSFKAFLISNLTTKHSVGANCEDLHDGEILTPLRRFVELANQIRHPVESLEGSSRTTDAESRILALSDLNDDSASTSSADEVSGMIAATVRKLSSLDSVKECEYCRGEIQSIRRDDAHFNQIYNIFAKRICHICQETQENALF